jgi:hypothetical protein
MRAVTGVVSHANGMRGRAVGFAVVAVGALLLGVGSLVSWVTLSFPDDIDPQGLSSTPVPGVDIWEGKVALGAAVAILALVVATRVIRSGAGALAATVVVIAIVAAGIAATAAVTADTRFIVGDGLDVFATALADDLGVPVSQVREALERQARDALEVHRGIGLWLSIAGGLVATGGGLLTLRWVRHRDRSWRPPQPAAEPDHRA